MSNQSNNHGRAYEYICLLSIQEEISKFRKCSVEKNSSFYAAESAWNLSEKSFQSILSISAKSAVQTIFDLEPLIIEDGDDELELKIQPDVKGESGDVRDILIVRRNIHWEVGLSLKHNHFAVKHSRLSQGLDFGLRWFNIKCSDKYWNAVFPIFSRLAEEKKKQTKWSDLPYKDTTIYVPLLQAFLDEIKCSYNIDKQLPRKMVEYLLGEFDFYKIISIDHEKLTQIQSFNLHGKLNQASSRNKPKLVIPIASLPTRIVSIEFKPNSTNTIELYLDGGWQFSFRIHSASTIVEPSLKFDIQIIGMPSTIISINCSWK